MSDQPAPPTASERPRRLPDALAVLVLVALWGLYFWRILTPAPQDALSLTEGDFSGQFVSFFGYQVERLAAGEVPLWNPYNYAGHPFLADTQSAVFYPPRLLIVALVSLGGDPDPGELYRALQTEMALHVLLGTLLMYAFVRRLIAPPDGAPVYPAIVGGLVAALTYGYGGYLSGYPQLQLAVLEAGIWLPLVLLGIFQATRTPRPGWLCLVLAGVALALSLLAGHPQTSLFMLYLALAFLAYRLWRHADGSWRVFGRRFVLAAALVGLVAGGLAAIQLLPGLEYLQHTTRQDLGFEAKSGGFPFSDLLQLLFPGFLTLWSPLYLGIAGLVLAIWAVIARAAHSAFFATAALLGLLLSFGAGTVLYDAAYLLLPGLSWFRGQERAAFVVAESASILAGLGAAHLLASGVVQPAARSLRRALIALAVVCGVIALAVFVAWRAIDGTTYHAALQSMTFAALLSVLAAALIPAALRRTRDTRLGLALVALIVFDLFSVTMGTANYDSIPAAERLPEPPMIAQLRDEMLPPGARVDGLRGLRGNWGTLYAVPDMRGISPLVLNSVHTYLEDLPTDRAWDLLAVRYVLTDWQELMAPSAIVDTGEDEYGTYNVHELESPRGFAHLTYGATIVPGDGEAYGLLREPAYDTRQHVILNRDPGLDLPGSAPDDPGRTDVQRFEPEHIVIEAETAAPAVLTLALPHYPGWQATVNGNEADLLRAYGGLSAVALPEAGRYTVVLRYQPWTYRAGLGITLIALLLVSALAVWSFAAARRARNRNA